MLAESPVRALVMVPAVVGFFVCLSTASLPARGDSREDPIFASLGWLVGPERVDLGEFAELALPGNFGFIGASGAQKMMELAHSPTSGNEMGLVLSLGESWLVLFQFNKSGYVRDDDKDKMDPDQMLKAIRMRNEEDNRFRQKRGWPVLNAMTWQMPPRYNELSHNLVWATRGESEGRTVVDYNMRVLGRSGAMKVTLLVRPEDLEAALPSFNALLAQFSYKKGHRYAEFRTGDPVAKYGLTALVTGDVTAVATNSGLLAKFGNPTPWFGILVVAGVMGMVLRSFGGRKQEPT
jgi:uncharacterized membrane-anchored protein